MVGAGQSALARLEVRSLPAQGSAREEPDT
jgi:hypothetical protein